MIKKEEDGVTHVNIYSKGVTRLGRLLSNFAYSPFLHPEDGEFESVEGYWYWLSSKDEELRKKHGWEAKSYGRFVGGKDWLDGDEFKRKIKLAIKSKIEQNQELHDLIERNTLPFKHYYIYNNKTIEPKEGKWLIDWINSEYSTK